MQEEIGLALDQDRHETGSGMDTLDQDRHDTGSGMDTPRTLAIAQTYANRTSGTWDLNIVETNNIVTEQFEKTTTSLKVSYDVTFKHDVSLEHDIIIEENDGNSVSVAAVNKPEIKLSEFHTEDIDKIVDLYDNVEFYNNKVNASQTLEVQEETFSKESLKSSHTCNEIVNTEFLSSKIKRNVSDSYLEVSDTVYKHERNDDPNSFENVVLKLKGFLSERVKGDESRSDPDSSDEYLSAETDFDSITRYSSKNERHRLAKRQARNEKVGYISSSENDSYLSDISNLESDFSDCRSLTSEEVKATLHGSFESKPIIIANDLENQTLFEAKENVSRDRASGANLDSNLNHSFIEPFKTLNKESNDKSFETIKHRSESVETGFYSNKSPILEICIPVGITSLEKEQQNTIDKSVDYQADIEESLQSELDKFNIQIDEIERSVRTSSLYNTDEIDGYMLDDKDHSGILADTGATFFDENVGDGETPDSFTGLEDVENLLKRSLHELNRSLKEPNEHETASEEYGSAFKWHSVNDQEKLTEIDQQNDVNKYFAVLGISSVELFGETGRKKGRSLSVPEISVANWKFSPENEENIPTEMVVGPYASMSNSYNENWNSSVFVEQNVTLKQRLLVDHLNDSKEKFEKFSVDLISNNESGSVSRPNEPRKGCDPSIKNTLITDSPGLDPESSRPIPSMKRFTEELDPGPVVIVPQAVSSVSIPRNHLDT